MITEPTTDRPHIARPGLWIPRRPAFRHRNPIIERARRLRDRLRPPTRNMGRMFSSAGWTFKKDGTGGILGAAGATCCCGTSGVSGGACSCCTGSVIGLSATLSFSGITYANCTYLPCLSSGSTHPYGTVSSALGTYCINLNGCNGQTTVTAFYTHLYGATPCGSGNEYGYFPTGSGTYTTPIWNRIIILIGKVCSGDGSGAFWQLQVTTGGDDPATNWGNVDLFYARYAVADCTSSVVIPNGLTAACSTNYFSNWAVAWGGSCSLTLHSTTC